MTTQARGDYKSIILKGDGVNVEALASGVISPGMLVSRTSAAVATVIAHATAAVAFPIQRMFVKENELEGEGIDVDFADGDRIPHVLIMSSGDRVLGIIDNGETIVIGDYLESAGNGKLQKRTSGDPVAVALKAIDLSDSSGADPSNTRIPIEIL